MFHVELPLSLPMIPNGVRIAAVLLLAGCSTGPSLETQREVTAPPGDSHHPTIGSAGFTESDLLAQMYAQLLNQAGYKTSLLTVANREPYEPALESGQIEVIPECAATFAAWLNAKTSASYARQHGLRTLSDLGASGLEVRLAAGDEWVQRTAVLRTGVEEDLRHQNADYVVPVVNRSRAGGAGMTKALDQLNDVLRPASDVARNCLRDKGLLK
ncbi:glycine betaine ABC transporter substrate-binding protein [Streptomyces sp. CA-249302]|uniref:glycine betaine ABC transporter substrate-binding protein n=1 Tax=Streptomyces sp. CA-249302 TaxID=3240058 RepID=UPI003D9015D1